MAIYEIKNFSGGIADYEDKGILGAFKFGANLNIRGNVDCLTCNQALKDEGLDSSLSPSASTSPSSSGSNSPSPSLSASPSPTPSPSASASPSASVSPSATASVSSSISPSPSLSQAYNSIFRDLIRFWVKATDGYLYGFGNRGYIYSYDNDGHWKIVYKDPDGEINGAAEWSDYNGNIYLYWSVGRKLHRKVIPGKQNWNDVDNDSDWPKTNLELTQWHTMRECGGSLIIANHNFLALVGFDNSYTNEALDLIPGNIATTIVERNGQTIVGTKRLLSETRSINGAIDSEVPLAQVGDDGEVFFANMSDSIPTKQFPGGGKVNPGGVCNEIDQVNFFEWDQDALSWIDKQSVGNMALFAVYGADSGKGGIYSYGRKNKNKPFVMNLEYQFDADELGAVTTIDGRVFFSYELDGVYGVKSVDDTLKADGIYEGLDFRSPIKLPTNITTYNKMEVYCDPLPSGSYFSAMVRLNKNGDFINTNLEGGSQIFDLVGERKAVFNISQEGEVFEPKIFIHNSSNTSVRIHRIRVYFN